MARTTVITGAAGALGSGLARSLAERGDRLILLDVAAAKDRLSTLAAELGGVAVTSWAEVSGDVDGAALVAGGWAGGHKLHEGGDDSWARMKALNADTVHEGLRALLPGMVARGQGSVVVVGARPVERPWTATGAAEYAATKAAAVALAEVAAAEVRSAGVRVNAVLPSMIDTPANRGSAPDADYSTWVSVPSLAGVIGFLLSDAAKDVSGAVIPVYGRA